MKTGALLCWGCVRRVSVERDVKRFARDQKGAKETTAYITLQTVICWGFASERLRKTVGEKSVRKRKQRRGGRAEK